MIAAVLVRCGLVILFLLFSARDKLVNFAGAVDRASEPFSWRPIAMLAILAGLGMKH